MAVGGTVCLWGMLVLCFGAVLCCVVKPVGLCCAVFDDMHPHPVTMRRLCWGGVMSYTIHISDMIYLKY